MFVRGIDFTSVSTIVKIRFRNCSESAIFLCFILLTVMEMTTIHKKKCRANKCIHCELIHWMFSN
jgi:hypothetical protein